MVQYLAWSRHAVDRDDRTHTGTVAGTGVDSRSGSHARGRITYRLIAEPGGGETAVSIEADIVLSGALAQFGRGTIVNDVATRLTVEFARCLQDRLNAATEAEAVAIKARDMGVVGIILAVLWERIRTVLGRLFGRTTATKSDVPSDRPPGDSA